MFFSKAGRTIAYLALVFGLLQIVLGVTFASTGVDMVAFEARYGVTTGELINRGFSFLGFALIIGILSEIGLKKS